MRTILALAFFSTFATAADPADLARRADADLPRLESLYRHLHAHPELSFQEEKTAARIAAELRSAGFEVAERVGGHGVVGVLKNGPKNGTGRTVLVRTDLDALPVKEETGLAFASLATGRDDAGTEVPIMHSCGHDVHMTVFCGVARLLADLRGEWKGTLVLVAQPAEERGSGARRMLADGLYTRFPKPDFALALHVNSELPAGSVSVIEGFALANVDTMDLTIRGVGGHGAFPQGAKDPIVLAAQTVLALQTIVSRETEPGQAAVVTVGSIHGGAKHNVIPDEVRLQLTLRSYTEEVRQNTIASIRRIAAGLAQAAGLPPGREPVIKISDGFTPATFNDPALARKLEETFKRTLGAGALRPTRPVMGGEDFSEYGRTSDKVPICIFWLGVVGEEAWKAHKDEKKPLPSLHSGFFKPDFRPAARTGVVAMAAAVLEVLGS